MSSRKNELLAHFLHFADAVEAAGHEAVLGVRNFNVYIGGNGQDLVVYPRFLEIVNGAKCYTDTLTRRTKRFIGWLPYRGKRWPAASDKLTFKRIAQDGGLLTPEFSTQPQAPLHDVLVKRCASSFGAEIKGPFRSSEDVALDLEAGEYFERFVRGRILKIWYWDATPVCLEMDECPRVEGDGHSTLRQLVLDRLARLGKQPATAKAVLGNVEQLIGYQGRGLDHVLEPGVTEVVEIRYGSKLHSEAERQIVDLRQSTPEYIHTDLRRIGAVAWNAIPADMRASTAFTVDAILDDEGLVWVLEMNCNPFIHPFVYQPMLQSLLAPERETQPLSSSFLKGHVRH